MTAGLRTLGARVRQNPGAVVSWFATFALTFLTTLGPVYSVRLGMGPLTTDFVDDATIQVFFAAFYGVLLIGLVRQRRRGAMQRSLALPLVGFCVVVLASTQWSVDQARTMTQAILLCLTAAAGVVVGQTTTVPSQITAVFASQQMGALLSLIAVLRHAPRWDDRYGHWTGIYFNRNSLGPVAALGLVATVGCVALLWSRSHAWASPLVIGTVIGLGAAAAVDVVLLRGSGSFTPLLGIGVAALAVGAVLGLRQQGGKSERTAGRTAAITLVGLTASIGIAWFDRKTFLPLVGKDPTLEARTPIWSLIRTFADQRPFRGWGWLGIWHFPEFQRSVQGLGLSQTIGEAHNGFLEVYLGTGLLGLVLILAFSVTLLWITARRAAARSGIALWPFALVVYALMVIQLESFIGANLLPWVLLTMAAGTVSVARREPHGDERSSGPGDDRGNSREFAANAPIHRSQRRS